MEALLNYLNTMFNGLPQTEEVRRAKKELQQMMEDKYHQLKQEGKTENEAVGQVISEFGNLDELAEQLGIGKQVSEAATPEAMMAMNSEQVERYLADNAKTSDRIALGVMACIISPVLLILLAMMADSGLIGENVAKATGLAAMFVFIAFGIYQFIVHGMAQEKYEELDYKLVALSPFMDAQVREKREAFQPLFARRIALGVILILVGFIIVTTISILEIKPDYILGIAIGILLLLVAISVRLFIKYGSHNQAFDKLLNRGDYNAQGKRGNETAERISGVYWSLVVAGYLLWSFLGNAWSISWVVWPIAGVLFGAVSSIAGLKSRESK